MARGRYAHWQAKDSKVCAVCTVCGWVLLSRSTQSPVPVACCLPTISPPLCAHTSFLIRTCHVPCHMQGLPTQADPVPSSSLPFTKSHGNPTCWETGLFCFSVTSTSLSMASKSTSWSPSALPSCPHYSLFEGRSCVPRVIT